MKDQPPERGFQERRLSRACKHVDDNWIPINPVVLSSIQAGIFNSRYEKDLSLLVSDLQQDLSLYIYCIKELCLMLQSDGVAIPAPKSISDLFDFAGLDRLRSILDLSAREISPHSLRAASPVQVGRLQEALLSATTTEVISAEFEELNAELGFTAALLRQLGLTLISWNYPEVYQRAVRSLSEQVNLDQAITEILGYSPTLLAIRLLRKWGIPGNLLYSVAIEHPDFSVADFKEFADSVADTLAVICKAGEALARANNPQIYPTAKSDWAECRELIEQRLGTQGIEKIQTRFEQNCGSYIDLMPELFRPGMLINPEINVGSANAPELAPRNPFIALCRPHLKQRLMQLYVDRVDANSRRQPLYTIIHEIIPLSGFTGGIIFTADPTTLLLVPQTMIGTPFTIKQESVKYTDRAHLVIKAFESPTLDIQEHKVTIQGLDERVVSIAWGLGFSQRIGALYLEVPTRVFEQAPNEQINHFNAILQAINDSLELG